jgi:hypothetical protein
MPHDDQEASSPAPAGSIVNAFLPRPQALAAFASVLQK